MITEDYVSFETAKLLKEKGFNEKCSRWYVANEPQEGIIEKGFGENQFYINAPTLQMAMKWLREVHNCNIEIDTIGQKSLDTLSWRSVIYNIEHDMECYYEDNFKSYEEACEAAIKYCLENLI